MGEVGRRGISGVATAVLLVGTIVVALLVVVWYAAVARQITGKPILRVSGSAVVVGNELYVTILNDGTVDYSGPLSITARDKTGSIPVSAVYNATSGQAIGSTVVIPAGGQAPLKVVLSRQPGPGVATVYGVIVTKNGEIPFQASVMRG